MMKRQDDSLKIAQDEWEKRHELLKSGAVRLEPKSDRSTIRDPDAPLRDREATRLLPPEPKRGARKS